MTITTRRIQVGRRDLRDAVVHDLELMAVPRTHPVTAPGEAIADDLPAVRIGDGCRSPTHDRCTGQVVERAVVDADVVTTSRVLDAILT